MNTPTEIVQSVYAAFGRGDIRWEHKGSIGLPYMGVFQGKAAVARWFGHVAENDDVQAFEPRQFLAGPDHVTVLGWERTRALPGGGVFETDWVHVFEVRGGRVSRFVGCYDTAAVAAARAR
jgi:ketosteroid isomerase-like protein